MRHLPSLSSLRLFLQVAYNCSFSEAARAANVSQPALSRTIRILEEQLGTRLFDRTSRTVSLTNSGNVLLPIVERLTKEFEHAFSELAHDFAGKRGRVALGALPSIAAGTLPAILACFQKQFPHVDISLDDSLSGDLYRRLQDRQIDLIISTPPEIDGFDFTKLIEDPLMLASPAGSEFDRSSPMEWAELGRHNFIAMAPRSSVRELTDKAFNQAGVVARNRYECAQLSTIGALIDAGLGVSALPESTLEMLRSERIVARRLVAPRIVREIGIATLRERTLPPAAASFQRHLLQSYAGSRPSIP